MLRQVVPFVLLALLLSACTPQAAPWPLVSGSAATMEPEVRVVAENLVGPIGMAALPNGALLVAEEGTGQEDKSAGVTMVMPDGTMGRLISGLPSSRDSGDLAGVPMATLSPEGDKLYLANFGQGHLWTLPLTEEQQKEGLELPPTPLMPEQLTAEMLPLNNVQLINPFDITFDAEGVPVVTDASGNGVAKQTPDGTTRFIHRFEKLADPNNPNQKVEAVPTGITRVEDEYYVTLTGGCPYPEGVGQLVAIDEARNQRTVLDSLNMPIDIARAQDGALWLLEFARFTPGASCFSGEGYRANSGRLSRLLPDGTLEPVLPNLDFPGAVLPMPDGSLYISEVFSGRILHVTFGDETALEETTRDDRQEAVDVSPSASRAAIGQDQYDALLQRVVEEKNLRPQPGADLREGDNALAQLGQTLFFDPILSGDKNIACATCHHPAFAMADGRVLPLGTGGHGLGPEREYLEEIVLGEEAPTARRLAGVTDVETGATTAPNPFVGVFVPRNSPSILNSALFPVQFWDGRVESYALGEEVRTREELVNELRLTDPLVAQALFPITSRPEMAGATFGDLAPQTIRSALIARLRATPAYVEQFRAVFGAANSRADEVVTIEHLAEALGAFQRRLIYTNAPWDRYLSGDVAALNEQQKRGALLFFGQVDPRVDCSACHSGDLFTDFDFHNLLVPQLGPGKEHSEGGREDWGQGGVTWDARDRYAFRTPTLRNVTLTAPYFHDGAFATLEETILHHADIWGSASRYDPTANNIPPALYSSMRPFEEEKHSQSAAPALRDGLPLEEHDIADLVAFLEALTDAEARDLRAFIPEAVPSGLPLDPLPEGPLPATPSYQQAQEEESVTSFPDEEVEVAVAPKFRDVAGAVGLDFRHGAFQSNIFSDPVAMMGGGLCWIDYNRDGWLDLYLINSHAEDEVAVWEEQGGLPRNALYRNDNGRFTDVSSASGTDLALWGNGCVSADFNQDGWWDLFVTADGPDALLWNNGDGTFTEGAVAAGVASPEWNSAAVVGDLNGDGWPDLFVGAYIDLNHTIPKPTGAFPQDYYGLADRLFLSNGPSHDNPSRVTFREVTDVAGLLRNERTLGAILSDLDLDGDLDLYIANDGQPNRLYANEPWPGGKEADPEGIGFRFADLTESAQVGDSGSGMGVAAGDYDSDGLTDLFVTNWERELNALYRNLFQEEGHLTFQYSTYRIGISGLGRGMTGWGTHFPDLDQDTDQDLLIVNGRVPVTNLETDPELVRYYRNRTYSQDGRHTARTKGQFIEGTEQVGLEEIGPLLARGSAIADYDNDGDLDIAINSIAGDVVLLETSGELGNWLQVVIPGFQPGTRVTVELPDGRLLVREWYAGSSYLASEDPRLHFGLGAHEEATRVSVRYPDGRQRAFLHVPANLRFSIRDE